MPPSCSRVRKVPLGAVIQDLFDGVDKRGAVEGPARVAPGDVPVGTHEDRPVVADLVVIEERVVVVGQARVADRVADDGHPKVSRSICRCLSPELPIRACEHSEARAN